MKLCISEPVYNYHQNSVLLSNHAVQEILANFVLPSYTVSENDGMGRFEVAIDRQPLEDIEIQLIAGAMPKY